MIRGDIFLKVQKYEKAVDEYTNCKMVINQNHTSHHSLNKDIQRKIQHVYDTIRAEKLKEFDDEQAEIDEQKKKLKEIQKSLMVLVFPMIQVISEFH